MQLLWLRAINWSNNGVFMPDCWQRFISKSRSCFIWWLALAKMYNVGTLSAKNIQSDSNWFNLKWAIKEFSQSSTTSNYIMVALLEQSHLFVQTACYYSSHDMSNKYARGNSFQLVFWQIQYILFCLLSTRLYTTDICCSGCHVHV